MHIVCACVCVCVCVCACGCACVRACVCAGMSPWTRRTKTCVCVRVRACVCVCARVYVRVCTCMHVCWYWVPELGELWHRPRCPDIIVLMMITSGRLYKTPTYPCGTARVNLYTKSPTPLRNKRYHIFKIMLRLTHSSFYRRQINIFVMHVRRTHTCIAAHTSTHV